MELHKQCTPLNNVRIQATQNIYNTCSIRRHSKLGRAEDPETLDWSYVTTQTFETGVEKESLDPPRARFLRKHTLEI